ncbi:MAG: hypothetical protein MJZ84_06935 [Paludibacteraceae bacterium]|nr:hypothetical protein [Paludibacteraceae bacterium]
MKKYLNPNSKQLKEHLQSRKDKKCRATSVYCEEGRPKYATRIWISYDINDDAPDGCRTNLEKWLTSQEAESFGESVATFLIPWTCYSTNSSVANWLLPRLKDAGIINNTDTITDEKPYLETPGLSLYVIYRSRNNGDGSAMKLYSGHFVLIQNANITHSGGY